MSPFARFANAATLSLLAQFSDDTAVGDEPEGDLVLNTATGALYGTTTYGGELSCGNGTGCGEVFELGPVDARNRRSFRIIHAFGLGNDGTYPFRGLVLDEAGNIFGTTSTGGSTYCGSSLGCGIVFELAAPTKSKNSWTETILHVFASGSDGANPEAALYRDPNTGIFYGTTCYGGRYSWGTVYSLAPPDATRRHWQYRIIYNFKGVDDGACPQAPVTGAAAGILYGTTYYGGGSLNVGTVFMLRHAPAGWTETILHSFGQAADGDYPEMGVTIIGPEDIIGATGNGGANQYGTIYEIIRVSGGSWQEKVVHDFAGTDGIFPTGERLVAGPLGILYGASRYGGGGGYGTVFNLSRVSGKWQLNTLYNFCLIDAQSDCDGGRVPANPMSGVTLNGGSQIYGTTTSGGGAEIDSLHDGTVFKLTP